MCINLNTLQSLVLCINWNTWTACINITKHWKLVFMRWLLEDRCASIIEGIFTVCVKKNFPIVGQQAGER